MYQQDDDIKLAQRIKEIIDKNFAKRLTYDDLTHDLGTNREKLRKVFKDFFGHNVYEYLTIVRIEKAKALLEETNYSIRKIAKDVGLDKSNLAKQFKKLTGKTPTDWKKNPEQLNGAHTH